MQKEIAELLVHKYKGCDIIKDLANKADNDSKNITNYFVNSEMQRDIWKLVGISKNLL